MDKLAAIKTFVAIVECGSQTEAARRIGKSQPSVVRSLAELEKSLSVQLIDRNTRQSSPTPEGETFYHDCKALLADLESAETKVREQRAAPLGRIKLTSPVEFGNIAVAPAILDIAERFPGMTLQVDFSDVPVDLIAGGYDIAVRLGPLEDSRLIARKVGTMRTFVWGSPDLIDKVGMPAHPTQLADLPCVGVDIAKRRFGLTWSFAEPDRKPFSVRVNPKITCDGVRMARTACLEGVGFCAFHQYQVDQEYKQGTLLPVLTTYSMALPALPVNLLWVPKRPMPRRLRDVIKILKDHIHDHLDGIKDVSCAQL
ncbi:MAG: LysR family transcriptional regulator [Paracoccaceae bacterium]